MNFRAIAKAILVLAVLSIVVFHFYQNYRVNEPIQVSNISSMADENIDNIDEIAPTYNDSTPAVNSETRTDLKMPKNQQSFICDSREHCSQMTSCEEATFFNNNCPNAKMDGNNDGVPCEQQWCN